VQSSRRIVIIDKLTPSFLQAGCPSCRQPTVSEQWKEKLSHSTDLLTQSSPEVFQPDVWPLEAPGYLGGGGGCRVLIAHFTYLLTYFSSASWRQSRIIDYSAICGNNALPAITDNSTRGAGSRHTTVPVKRFFWNYKIRIFYLTANRSDATFTRHLEPHDNRHGS